MLSNVTKKCGENLMLWNSGKPVVGRLSLMFKCSWKMLFLESKDTEVLKADINKLFASNEKQTDHHTLMQRCLSWKIFFWWGWCSLLIFVAIKAGRGTELQFLCTQGTRSKVEEYKTIDWCLPGSCTHHNHIFKQYSKSI